MLPKLLSEPTISKCPRARLYQQRSNPTSPPSYTTINNMDCCIEWLLFGSLYFSWWSCSWTRHYYKYKKSSKNQPGQNGHATIQPPTYPAYNMEIGVWSAILEFYNFQVKIQSGLSYTTKFSPNL